MDAAQQERLENALLANRMEEAFDILVEVGDASVTVDEATGEKRYELDEEVRKALGEWLQS